MTKRITNYEELVNARKELEASLQLNRELIRQDLQGIKEGLHPATQLLSFLGKITRKDRTNPIMVGGASLLIDVVVKRMVLGRAGWFTKFIIPFFLKNYSSHFLSEKKLGLWKKITSLFKPGKNGKHGAGPASHDVSFEKEQDDQAH